MCLCWSDIGIHNFCYKYNKNRHKNVIMLAPVLIFTQAYYASLYLFTANTGSAHLLLKGHHV